MISPADYECAVLEKLRLDFHRVAVSVHGTEGSHEHRFLGRFSLVKRQLDAAAYRFGDSRPFLIADAKRHKTKVDVKDTEAFIGMVDDIGADIGLLVAPVGFTAAAVRRAAAAATEVRIMTVKQALTYKWLPLARQIYPHDWVFRKELALAVRLLHKKAPPEDIIGALEPVAFDEWDAFVAYALRHHQTEAFSFLRSIVSHHDDDGWRFNALNHLIQSGGLDACTTAEILAHELDPEIREFIEKEST
ncbi:restriction endonuclease [uncultured Thiodictyon sp.]|uniref:restriction endonuclease n=1 Tax=uncultured Thiodictyon sp. TaxID=1846217 RepID=UPI0025DF446B|nr:restriction endonuclease [uncultured Thiodictyon sp.]